MSCVDDDDDDDDDESGIRLDPWDHRAIEYVMVPKSQYLSLYRANRLLRDPCCCQGLGKARKLCDNCLQPTVILRSPSPAVSVLPTSEPRHSPATGSLQTRRARAPAASPTRAQTLLPRLSKSKQAEQQTAGRPPHFSSQELLLDCVPREHPIRQKAHSSSAALVLAV
ncbi:uncharacterized protein LOC119109225 [Pollicipes pollicipes]|uniref:uncharacterized protein LOC119109225 n=1 Tax=Pollicipes pollicipes TaxID=41117 RepID=UPI001884E72A|nr:uncharacterized protein LOC119109225 [Pollicipes pollicipes]